MYIGRFKQLFFPDLSTLIKIKCPQGTLKLYNKYTNIIRIEFKPYTSGERNMHFFTTFIYVIYVLVFMNVLRGLINLKYD